MVIPENAHQAEFAIVMTSFARDFLLDEAIWSIRNQTYQDWALYIIDDNSDRLNPLTKKVIMKHAIEDTRIVPIFRKDVTWEHRRRVSWTENINLVLNDLVDRRLCKYVVYSTCDDYKYPNQLEVLAKHLQNHRVVIAKVRFVRAPDWRPFGIAGFCVPPRSGIWKRGTMGNRLADHNGISHRLEILLDMERPYWSEQDFIVPDGVFVTRLSKKQGHTIYVPTEILGDKRWHRGGIIGKKLVDSAAVPTKNLMKIR